jgi:hypothetical protein
VQAAAGRAHTPKQRRLGPLRRIAGGIGKVGAAVIVFNKNTGAQTPMTGSPLCTPVSVPRCPEREQHSFLRSPPAMFRGMQQAGDDDMLGELTCL